MWGIAFWDVARDVAEAEVPEGGAYLFGGQGSDGCALASASATTGLFSMDCEILELVKLGAMQLTRILGANSAASVTVRPSIAALAVAIIVWLVKPF